MENNERLGVVDNNNNVLELTKEGFLKVYPSRNNKETPGGIIIASLLFLIFAVMSLTCLFIYIGGGVNDGIFGVFAFVCIVPAIIALFTVFGYINAEEHPKEKNNHHKKYSHDFNDFNYRHNYHIGSYSSEDDPITGTDYVGSYGNIYD